MDQQPAIALARAAFAQMYTPVNVCAVEPIADQFGNRLRGGAQRPDWDCCLVQVLWASNSTVLPPAFDGRPDLANPPVEGGAARMGNLTAPDIVDPGFFSISLSNPRPPQNSRFFVRVFNAGSAEDATFYADSQVLRVRNNDVLVASIGATTNAIDPRDSDGDGLNNSWEKVFGSDPEDPDSDGDGSSDGDEFLAGTSLLDPDSVFRVSQIERTADGRFAVTWESTAGKDYRVQGASEPAGFSNLPSSVHADGPVTHTVIMDNLSEDRGFFRMRLEP